MANTIYNNISHNKNETYVIMALFIVVVSFVGWFVGYFFFGQEYAGFVLVLALIFSGISSFFSYFYSDSIVLAISRAREVLPTENPDLHKLVENMCIASGLPKPRIFMIDDTAMNAFATGRDPKHAVICFTSGIVTRLEKRELEGVIAHELSHIQNYDIRLMSIVSILVGSITLMADWFTRGVFYGGGRRRSREGGNEFGGLLLIFGIVLVVLSPIIATLIQLALSRDREYLADASGALMTRYPQGLVNALEKLSSDNEILEAANGATAHLYICSPLRGEQGGFLAGLFDTHPPIQERIKRLKEM